MRNKQNDRDTKMYSQLIIIALRSNTSTSNHNFFLCLLFDLDYRGLLFASTKNLKTGPRFADICSQQIIHNSSYCRLAFCLHIQRLNSRKKKRKKKNEKLRSFKSKAQCKDRPPPRPPAQWSVL